MLANNHLTLGSEGIGHGELSLHIGHVEGRDHRIAIHLTALELHLRILPDAEAVLETCAVVVVGRCTPEFRQDGAAVEKHGLAIYIEVVDPARLLTDGERGACGRETHVRRGLFN